MSDRLRIIELRQERAGLIHQARSIIEAADSDDRGLTEEEEQRYDALMEDVGDMTESIERRERVMSLESDLQESIQVPSGAREQPGDNRGDQRRVEFVSDGLRSLNEQHPDWMERREWRDLLRTAEPAYERGFRSFLRRGRVTPEMRALQADLDVSGGYLVAPIQFVDRLIKGIDNLVYMRQWGTGFTVTSAESLGAPSLDNDPADPTWTSELDIGSEDSTMSFGRRELHPRPLAKYIKLSRKLLRMVPDVESLTRRRLGYKFSVSKENAYLNGDGSGGPLGVFTASDNGISTSRDVSEGNTTTEIRFDGLIEAKYTLKAQYWPRARWIMHRDGVKQVAKLKNGEGQYIWRESTRVGEPDRILGFPAFMSEYAPNTFTASQYVGILGDFSNYWYADALDMDMQRLVELFAETNEIGLVGRMESDGMPVLSEAFVRVQLSS